ncbi:PepSY-associated TM helix domain-containing protein [Pseudooceanicola nitratireducens]|uniref:PepSY-associated TM helix domain-containing protein n=1 Tax=Pseudooceanicola nitratireducens TaxID=517719 RepID=UPI001C94F868|nr:PepSY domain-containing protein [Pseudooceanicola nitratireducens]MBY6156554.1 PepSY domain-containing protein [Pseudooceanicola nitratireducens]
MTDTTNRAASSALYRAVWRWHFIAGLLVLPFVIILAVTGGIYLFKDEINNAAYRDLRIVAPTDGPAQPASQITANALAAHPGTLKAYHPAPAPDRTAEVKILGEDGLKNSVFVNPATGEVLGTLWDAGASGSPAMYVVRKLHSLEYVGWFGNRVIEAVAGWMVLLTASGVYLWWPRVKKVGTATIKAKKGRPWWRDLHAVTGIYTAGFIVFLAMTGLPWSKVWGGYFYDSAYALGLGMPDSYWSTYPSSTVPAGEALDRTPWIMEKQAMPQSAAANGVPAGIDQVVATVETLGIAPGYALNMPSGDTGVFTASVYPDDITQERVIHLDQYTGEVLYDATLADLGALGWAAEWGISIHMGQAFGLANQLILLLSCVAMVVMCVAGGVMWWKRRPSGALGVPQIPADWRIPRTLLVMAIVAGVFFPLVGLTLIVLSVVEVGVHLLSRVRLRAA